MSTNLWVRLTECILAEAEAMETLIKILQTQRSAVAEVDSQDLRQQTDAMNEAIRRLEEVRNVREDLFESAFGNDALDPDGIEERIGGVVPADFRTAWSELSVVAKRASRELRINHRVLTRARSTGEVFFQTLFAHLGMETPSYLQGEGGKSNRNSLLINKVA